MKKEFKRQAHKRLKEKIAVNASFKLINSPFPTILSNDSIIFLFSLSVNKSNIFSYKKQHKSWDTLTFFRKNSVFLFSLRWVGGGSLSISLSIRELLLRQIYLNSLCLVVLSYFVNLGSVCLSILFTCTMCFCLIYFNLSNVGNCIDMYLGISVNKTEVEVEI